MRSTEVPSFCGQRPAIRNCDNELKGYGFAGYRGWLLLVLLVAPLVFMEVFLAVAPSVLVYAILVIIGVASILWSHSLRKHANREGLLQIIVLLACLAILNWVPRNTRKVFLSQFNRIQSGMTIDEVDSILRPLFSLRFGASC
jgi:hypothetical protein